MSHIIAFPRAYNRPPSGPWHATVLRDIRGIIRSHATCDSTTLKQHRQLDQQCRELQQRAIKYFADSNNWRHSHREFRLQDIGGKRTGYLDRYASDIFDHLICFRQGKCAALVTQPYNYDRDAALALAAQHGLALHVPPHPLASIWFPDATAFLVFAEPGHVVQWLPEQVNGIDGGAQR